MLPKDSPQAIIILARYRAKEKMNLRSRYDRLGPAPGMFKCDYAAMNNQNQIIRYNMQDVFCCLMFYPNN